MFCSRCGAKNDVSYAHCSSCGSLLNSPYAAPQYPTAPPPTNYQIPMAPPARPNSEKFGLSLSAMLVALYTIFSGVTDLNGVASGVYGFIYASEVGLLFLLSIISLGLSIPAVVQKTKLSAGALTLSLIALVLSLACAAYIG